MTDDIVTTLRRNHFYLPTSRINSFGMPQMGFEMTSFNLIAADEIERLRADAAFLRGELDTSRMRFCDLMIRHGEMEAEMRERNNKLLHRLQEYEAREAK